MIFVVVETFKLFVLICIAYCSSILAVRFVLYGILYTQLFELVSLLLSLCDVEYYGLLWVDKTALDLTDLTNVQVQCKTKQPLINEFSRVTYHQRACSNS